MSVPHDVIYVLMAYEALREYVHAQSLADKPISLKALFPFPQQSQQMKAAGVYTLVLKQPDEIYVTQFTKLARSHFRTTEVCLWMRAGPTESAFDESPV